MKFILYLLFLSTSAHAFDLAGTWDAGTKAVEFIEVEDTLYTQTTERFVFPDGELSHSIQQSFKIAKSTSRIQVGTVDIFDSRGCSFKDLEVKLQFQSADEVNFLITYPRYKIVTITTGPTSGHYRPVYCASPYPRGRPYVCGREYVRPSQRQECRLVEYVKTPVTLRR
jgi:hypothetical protein